MTHYTQDSFSIDKSKDTVSTAGESKTVTEVEILRDVVNSVMPKRPKKIQKTVKQSNHWTAKETEDLLELMQVFGTDFSLIACHLKTKTRDQIKRKFGHMTVAQMKKAMESKKDAEKWADFETEDQSKSMVIEV